MKQSQPCDNVEVDGKRRYTLIIINLLNYYLRHQRRGILKPNYYFSFIYLYLFGTMEYISFSESARVRVCGLFEKSIRVRNEIHKMTTEIITKKLYQKEFIISIRCSPCAPRTKFYIKWMNFTLHQYDLISIRNAEEVKFIALCWKFCCFVFIWNRVGSDGSSAETNLRPKKSI